MFEYGLADEDAITWAPGESPGTCGCHYLRETLLFCPRRRGAPRKDLFPGRVVCWADLSPKARPYAPSTFLRRVWWLRPEDPDGPFYGPRYVPCEGADPASLRPRVPSSKPVLPALPTEAADHG